MRKRFEGFGSAVDLDQIDTVSIRQMPHHNGGAEVVITTKGGNEIVRTFIAIPGDTIHQMHMLTAADACIAQIEWWRRWGLRLERIGPHVATWVASVATATGLSAWLKTKF